MNSIATADKSKSNHKKYWAPYDKEEINRAAAAYGWPRLLSELVPGTTLDTFDGRKQPCPLCGGDDRFRYVAERDNGSCVCSNCHNHGNGFGLQTLAHLLKVDQQEAIRQVGEKLNVPQIQKGKKAVRQGKGTAVASAPSASIPPPPKAPKGDPAELLDFQPWNSFLAEFFCEKKPPISPEGLQSIGARFARWKDQYTVLAVPIWDASTIQASESAAKIIGWSLWNVTGGTLPGNDGEWLKVRTTKDSNTAGLMGDLARIRSARVLIKTEGPSDLAALHSLADLPQDVAGITNGAGAMQNKGIDSIADLFACREALVIHDADKPGEDASAKWAHAINGKAASVCKLLLPYEVKDSHGKDLRDYLAEQHGEGYAAIGKLQRVEIGNIPAPAVRQGEGKSPGDWKQANEADDDPHRLARIVLAKFEADGGRLVYWRGGFCLWRPATGCYVEIDADDLKVRMTATIKAEFDRINLEELNNSTDTKKAPPTVRPVQGRLLADVLGAVKSLSVVDPLIEPNSWLESPDPTIPVEGTQLGLVALKNGLLDIELALAGEPPENCLQPPTPKWFSFVRLPCNYDPDSTCKVWNRFLETAMEGDADRINRLQEWAGYLITPDLSHQKFLAMEGNGGNGKSVYIAGITAMLGADNVSTIALENLGERFQVASTVGKLANICADANSVDLKCMGFLKSFTSGDRVHADLKYKRGMDFLPTARLMLAWNTRPRFNDSSDGTWRRMLMVTWVSEVKKEDRVYGMDIPSYWKDEVSGIFWWALNGLARLRKNRDFTESRVCDTTKEEYRDEMNSSAGFLRKFCKAAPLGGSVEKQWLYGRYKHWCIRVGQKFPAPHSVFGREVKRMFPGTKDGRPFRPNGQPRPSCHEGIEFDADDFNREFPPEPGASEKELPDSLRGF